METVFDLTLFLKGDKTLIEETFMMVGTNRSNIEKSSTKSEGRRIFNEEDEGFE